MLANSNYKDFNALQCALFIQFWGGDNVQVWASSIARENGGYSKS